ncbi:MAG: peptidoglycan-binding protein, partial [Clostridiales bacterium]|nr:peptidoglycan-binding protein [Clostridiales bacterium]
LSTVYPNIPRITADGVFGPATENAVRAFQRQFGLTADGVIGLITWNSIVEQYNRLPVSPPPGGPAYPGMPLRLGSRGEDVRIMQQYLNALSTVYPNIPRVTADGVFGPATQNAVIAFQRQFGLTPDGVIGPITWSSIVTQYNRLPVSPPPGPAFPGTPLRLGSRGESVRVMQQYLNVIRTAHPSIPQLTADGVFGPATQNAVVAFQRQFGLTPDGVIGPVTWNSIVAQHNNISGGALPVIVLDPGHGGSDPGAVNGARMEKNDNLNMALAVRRNLQAQGQRVVMTRSTDVYVPLLERSTISNRNGASIFVSLHRNAFANPAASGVETYVQVSAPSTTVAKAQNVHNEIVGAGVQSDRGVKRGDFSVLRNTRAPAMLVELGFISNAADNRLFDENFEAYAAAIARGILKSLAATNSL